MKSKTIAAAVLSTAFYLSMSQGALAGKPSQDVRDPSNKDCADFVVSEQYCDAAFATLYGSFRASADVFISRNAANDIGTLECKTSGAELKLAQEKFGEASGLLDDIAAKLLSLEGQGKLDTLASDWDPLIAAVRLNCGL